MDPVSVIKSWDDLPLPPVEFKTRLCSCNVSPSCTFFLGPHWKPRHYWNWSTQPYLWRREAYSLNYNVYFILSFFFFNGCTRFFFWGKSYASIFNGSKALFNLCRVVCLYENEFLRNYGKMVSKIGLLERWWGVKDIKWNCRWHLAWCS